jgi:hypothetical protein
MQPYTAKPKKHNRLTGVRNVYPYDKGKGYVSGTYYARVYVRGVALASSPFSTIAAAEKAAEELRAVARAVACGDAELIDDPALDWFRKSERTLRKKKNKTGVPNVFFRRGRYSVILGANNQQYVRTYDTLEEATEAAKDFRIELAVGLRFSKSDSKSLPCSQRR